VQEKGLIQGIGRSGCDHAAVQGRGCLRHRQIVIRVKQSAVTVHRERVISPEQVRQFFNGLAMSLRDSRQMFPQCLDGLLSVFGFGQGELCELLVATFNGLLGVCADDSDEVQ
jgi:hypothetical protein